MFFALSEFLEILNDAAKQFPTKHALATAIGITPSRFSRVLAGVYRLNVLNCLTLAQLTGLSPSRVLRAAGKAKVAAAIESLYGPAATGVTPREREFLNEWHALPDRAREGLLLTMRAMRELSRQEEAAPAAARQRFHGPKRR